MNVQACSQRPFTSSEAKSSEPRQSNARLSFAFPFSLFCLGVGETHSSKVNITTDPELKGVPYHQASWPAVLWPTLHLAVGSAIGTKKAPLRVVECVQKHAFNLQRGATAHHHSTNQNNTASQARPMNRCNNKITKTLNRKLERGGALSVKSAPANGITRRRPGTWGR